MKVISLKCCLLLLCLISLEGFAQTKSKKTTIASQLNINKKAPNGHIRCVSSEYEATLREKFPNRASASEFETWMAQKIAVIKAAKSNSANATNSVTGVVTIPVVVHVIHNGDALGVDENISDAQVLSQITVLNQDFRKMLGTPGYNTNSVGADVEINFCMAQRTPAGGATNGIDRVNLGVASWGESQVEATLKPQTQWDPTQYFNIWVCNFGGDLDGVLGYAQFPSTSGLGGLDDDGGTAATDGVIIGYKYFGSSDIYPGGTYESPYDKGRTATHEIGHCFGLLHIWGDNSSCTVNATDSQKDYCLDTPAASAANYGCTVTNSCTAAAGNDMIENYMDYTDDTCMNIFTVDQKARITAVLQNSIRRASLTTSIACSPPQTYGFDGQLNIMSLNVACGNTFSPTLQLVNQGETVLTSAEVQYSIDNANVQTYIWSGLLAAGASATITLDPLTAVSGSHTFYAALTGVNATTDENATNDSKSEAFIIVTGYTTATVTLSLQKDKYGSETSWSFKNSAGTVLYSGGPYTDTNSLPAIVTQAFTVTAGECYTFTINDEYGDGICCTYGNGYYNLKTSDNTVIVSGTNFGTSAVTTFGINSALGTATFDSVLDNIVLYPNPAENLINIAVQDGSALPESFTIYNSLGQVLRDENVTNAANLQVNISALSSGIYFVKVKKDNASKTLRFTKR